jgi:hypothetical protein
MVIYEEFFVHAVERRLIFILFIIFYRYIFWWVKTWIVRRVKPFIDFITLNGKQIYGMFS